MPKYSSEERKALAAAADRLGAGRLNGKVADLRMRAPQSSGGQERPKKATYRHESEADRCDRMIKEHKLSHLHKADSVPPYQVESATRYPKVTFEGDAGKLALERILRRYGHVMKPQGITPTDFRMWREHFMLMTPEQLAALVRVSSRTIRNWESGANEIPFSMWWVMHVTLQDPEYFLTRPGFHDFYIEYLGGEAYLCSHSYPDIRWTATDLYFNRCALSEVYVLREQIKKREEKVDELTAENTRLRQLLKTEGVTGELQAMQDHIGALMKRIQTADVKHFQTAPQAAQSTDLIHKAA
jgi:DNA-binding XRE family transcriptional regulator